jgi:hypothetical protein
MRPIHHPEIGKEIKIFLKLYKPKAITFKRQSKETSIRQELHNNTANHQEKSHHTSMKSSI